MENTGKLPKIRTAMQMSRASVEALKELQQQPPPPPKVLETIEERPIRKRVLIPGFSAATSGYSRPNLPHSKTVTGLGVKTSSVASSPQSCSSPKNVTFADHVAVSSLDAFRRRRSALMPSGGVPKVPSRYQRRSVELVPILKFTGSEETEDSGDSDNERSTRGRKHRSPVLAFHTTVGGSVSTKKTRQVAVWPAHSPQDS